VIIGVTHDHDGGVVQRLPISTKVSIGLPPNADRNHPTKLDHFVLLRKKKSANRVEWEADPELSPEKPTGNCDIGRQTGELPNYEGWTGAEIKECCPKAHRLGMTLIQAAKYIVPVSRSAAEQVKALRQMASGKFISASTPGVYQYQENQSVPRGRVIRDLEGPLTVMPPSRSEA